MKNIFFFVVTSFLIGCAQMSPLTGGYKDTIPPNLIASIPPENSTNVNPNQFYFAFDELIDASKLQESIIISPFYSGKKEVKYKKNEVSISFDTLFDNNTTYIINFAGGISDVTEGNDLSNAKLIFSTGEYIDSASISGVIYNPNENKRVEGALVGLYQDVDSLDLFHKKPIYFTFSDESGKYEINNVKPDKYTIYAFIDENKSFIAEFKNEAFGFYENTVEVNNKTKKIKLNLNKEDLSELRLIRNRSRGNVYEIIYSKKLDKIRLVKGYNLKYSLNDNKNIVIYKNPMVTDSLLVIIEAFDLSGNTSKDSIYVTFNDENEYKEEFSYTFNSYFKKELEDTINFSINLNKPVLNKDLNYRFVLDTIKIPDSLYFFKLSKELNSFEGLFKLNQNISNLFLDNHQNIYSKNLNNDSLINLLNRYYQGINRNKISFMVEKGEVFSIEGDTLDRIKQDFKFNGSDFYGQINGTVFDTLGRKNLVTELISIDFKRVYNNRDVNPKFNFINIPPGKYYLRTYNDKNNNNMVDVGSILYKNPGEDIIYNENEIEIRSNWVIEDFIFDVNNTVDILFNSLEEEQL
ncbi:MAG: Ig-like domain-containing domain [Bacteroidota bacterium]|nr:Ig-like domain-containing domain [Bacteroidota bacterium]